MKLFVDKMPENCNTCPFRSGSNKCGVNDEAYVGFRFNDRDQECPLHSLAEHDAKLTKQVCQELVNAVTKKMK